MVELLEQATGTQGPARAAADAGGRRRETYADISAIERDLGFPPATTIDEGVPRFVDWYREYHKALMR